MQAPIRLWSQHLANLARGAFWLLLVVLVLSQLFGGGGVGKERAALLVKDTRAIAHVLRPYPTAEMAMHRVSRRVSDSKAECSELIAPVGDEQKPAETWRNVRP